MGRTLSGMLARWVDPLISLLTAVAGALACVMLAWLAYSLVVPFTPKMARSAQAGRDADPLTLPEAPGAKKDTFDAVLFGRNKLFDCEDAPAKGVTAQARPGEQQASFTLLGVSFGGRKLAVIRDESDKKEYYLSEGESIGGFRVGMIEKNRVVLDSDGQTMELVK